MTTASRRVIMISGDLFFVSRVEGAARGAGCQLEMISDLEKARHALALTPLLAVIIDLATPGLDVAEMVEAIPHNESGRRPPVVAYGAHIDVDRLKAARAAGCDSVMPRSQFSTELPNIFRRFVDE